MKAIGILVVFGGYAVTYYGLSQIMGGNWGFADLTLPITPWSKIAKTPKDHS